MIKQKNIMSDALLENVNAFNVYPFYIDVLLWNEDLDEAAKLMRLCING